LFVILDRRCINGNPCLATYWLFNVSNRVRSASVSAVQPGAGLLLRAFRRQPFAAARLPARQIGVVRGFSTPKRSARVRRPNIPRQCIVNPPGTELCAGPSSARKARSRSTCECFEHATGIGDKAGAVPFDPVPQRGCGGWVARQWSAIFDAAAAPGRPRTLLI